ncbi:MAG: NAD(P)-dependent oxidoreductase [Pseudomonadales bacterium]|nr:NAD(P)-dependent oxidoreductase [Pseudomonadales bacterium]
MKIGFIGVGHMGGPMCHNIIKKSGHDVTVFDLSHGAIEECVALGASGSDSIAELASNSDVIFTSLPMPKDVEAVALGADGIAENAKSGTVYIDLSTNSPTVIRKVATELEKKGISTLDAPVSGGVIGATKGTIAIMVGGDKGLYEKYLPLFESFGENISHLGDLGCGCIAKIVNNMIAFCNMAAGAEGLMLGAAAGIDPSALNQVIRNSSGNSMGYRGMAYTTLKGDWTPSFALDLAYKDMHLALELADELSIPLSISPQVHNLMRMARGMGYGKDDTTAMMRVYEETTKIKVRK